MSQPRQYRVEQCITDTKNAQGRLAVAAVTLVPKPKIHPLTSPQSARVPTHLSVMHPSQFPVNPRHHRPLFFPSRAPSLLPSLFLSVLLITAFVNNITSPPPIQLNPTLHTLPEEKIPHTCPDNPSYPPLYIFLHLHKTAGNNLKNALFSFSNQNSLNLHHTCHPTLGDTPFQSLWFNRLKPNNSIDCNLDILTTLPSSARQTLDFVMGHQFVGAHSLFPHRDVRYFTFVRHPLRRKVSHFIHFEPHDNINKHTLAKYLIERNRNYMTKRLATDTTHSEVAVDLRARFVDVDNFAARAALRAAKRNLQHRFFFVGIVERYQESVCVLDRILRIACGRKGKLGTVGLDVGRVVKSRHNYRGNTQNWVDKVGKRVRTAALKAEAADWQLYRFALELFESKLEMYPECREQ